MRQRWDGSRKARCSAVPRDRGRRRSAPPGYIRRCPLHAAAVQLSSRSPRARCSTSRRRTASSRPATTAPTCSCSSSASTAPAKPGVAFSLVNKLLAFNADGAAAGRGRDPVAQRPGVGHARVPLGASTTGCRSQRGVFTRGAVAVALPAAAGAPTCSCRPTRPTCARRSTPACRRRASSRIRRARRTRIPNEVRIAFDGDAVLFSDEAERVFQARRARRLPGARARRRPRTPLPAGPFKPLLEALHRLQQAEPTATAMRIRTALVTARSAPAHERAIRTLMDWNIEVDEAMFLGGLPKGEFLREFEPDFFFDDQTGHVDSAARTCRAGHVPHGIANEEIRGRRMTSPANPFTLAHWRHTVAEHYAAVRALAHRSAGAHSANFPSAKDALFREHPDSPDRRALARRCGTGLRWFPYDPAGRVDAAIDTAASRETFDISLASDGVLRCTRVGHAHFRWRARRPQPCDVLARGLRRRLVAAVLRRHERQRRPTAAAATFYDTIKGADLGVRATRLVLDFNFAYNPSCAYDDAGRARCRRGEPARVRGRSGRAPRVAHPRGAYACARAIP